MRRTSSTRPDLPAPAPAPAPAPTLAVVYTPLHDAVALLDTSGGDWVMHLDADSPAEDHIWALLEALEILAHHGDTARTAAQQRRHLHLVPPPATTTR